MSMFSLLFLLPFVLNSICTRHQIFMRTRRDCFWGLGVGVLLGNYLCSYYFYIIQMRNLRKQIKLLSNLLETILQYRLNPYHGLPEHLAEMAKKMRTMALTQNYEEAIAEMLTSKQNFQIRNKIMSLQSQMQSRREPGFTIQVQISTIEKSSCQKYNQQVWQFKLEQTRQTTLSQSFNPASSTVQLLNHMLRYLLCYSLLPLNKQHRNKYMIDHKVIVSCGEIHASLNEYGNLSTQGLVLARNGDYSTFVETAYYFNQSKVQGSLRDVLVSRRESYSGNSKKNSFDTMDSLRRVSIYEYYDPDLDITVLSGSDSSENGEVEICIEDEEFQLLIQETKNNDELLLNGNRGLFKELDIFETGYL